MRHHNSLFHQLLQFVPWGQFHQLVESHGADRRVRRMTTKSQLIALMYGQLAGAQSLREIEQGMASHAQRLYHLGAAKPARSTFADANAKRPAQLFADLFAVMTMSASSGLRRCMREAVHLVDATSIRLTDLSRAWADYKAHGALVKLHVDFDADRSIPANIAITPARVNDVSMAQTMPIEPGATYVFDLGYYDFSWWAKLHQAGCRFVTRLKTHTRPRLIEERPVAPGGSICADRIVAIDGRLKSARGAQHPLAGMALREVVLVTDDGRTLRLITNDLDAPAADIAALYKARWQIELFFRWIKQHLKIQRFLGTSENAIRIQIAVALIVFLMLRLAAAASRATCSLLTFVRLVRANLMHLRPLTGIERPPPPMHRDVRQQELCLC
jgi:hypothetical protein